MNQKTGYFFVKNTHHKKLTSLNIIYHTGPSYEARGRRGVAHLMEHMITKCIDKYQPQFTKDCITFNAMTTTNYIQVYFTGIAEKLTPELKQQLVKELLHSFDNLSKEDYKIEQDVVLQEISDDFDSPDDGFFSNILYNYYNVTLPLGTPKDVGNFTYEQAKELAENFFNRPAAIIERGDEPTDFSFVEYNTDEPFPILIWYKERNRKVMEEAESNKCIIYAINRKLIKKTDYIFMKVGLLMLADGESDSPLFDEIRNKRGLSYYAYGDLLKFDKTSLMYLTASTDKEKAEELKTIMMDICRNVKNYLTKERYDNIIEMLTTKRKMNRYINWDKVDEYILPMMPRLNKKSMKLLSYDRVVGTMEKYFYSLEFFTKEQYLQFDVSLLYLLKNKGVFNEVSNWWCV